MLRSPPPRGKTIVIGSEQVEVFPTHCTNGFHHTRCFFIGKYPCASRWWLYPPVYLAPSPEEKTGYFNKKAISLDILVGASGGESDTFANLTAGQPLIPLNDGGFVEEITNIIMSRQIPKNRAPVRDTDQSCLKCGYSYLRYKRFDKKRNKEIYSCPQCGAERDQDSKSIPEAIKPAINLYLRELWEQGVTRKEIIICIQSRHSVEVSMAVLKKMIRHMGLTRRIVQKPDVIKPYLRELWEQGVILGEIIKRIQSRHSVSIGRMTVFRLVKSMGLAKRKPGMRRR